jgi:lipopolysaccharide export LptBFGC system permease protein LptF
MENLQLERDQDYTTTITETNLNQSEKPKDIDIDKIIKENETIFEFMRKNNIDINELINSVSGNNNDSESVFIDISDEDKNEKQLTKNNNKNTRNNKKNSTIPQYAKQDARDVYIRDLRTDINEASVSRNSWAKVAMAMFCISEILTIVQTGLSFTAASYQIILISYLAGIIGVVAIGLNRFGAYSRNQSNEQNFLYNKLLKKMGINDSMPNLLEISDDKKNDKK